MHAEKVCKFSISYLKSISDEDFIVLDDKETSIASALAILNASFCHWEGRKDFISHGRIRHSYVMQYLLIYIICYCYYSLQSTLS